MGVGQKRPRAKDTIKGATHRFQAPTSSCAHSPAPADAPLHPPGAPGRPDSPALRHEPFRRQEPKLKMVFDVGKGASGGQKGWISRIWGIWFRKVGGT